MKVLTLEQIKGDIIGANKTSLSLRGILLSSTAIGIPLGLLVGEGFSLSVVGEAGIAVVFVLVLMLCLYIHRRNIKDNAELAANGNFEICKAVCDNVLYDEGLYTYRFSCGSSYTYGSGGVFVAPDCILGEGNTYYLVRMPFSGCIMAVYGASEYTADESLNDYIK